MRLKNKQSGMTFFGLLIVLGLIGFFAMVAMKTLPLYLDFASVSKALETIEGDKNLGRAGKKGIFKRIDAQFYIDDVKTLKAKDVLIERDKTIKAWRVTADYEAKTNLLSNIYIMVHFNKTAEIPY